MPVASLRLGAFLVALGVLAAPALAQAPPPLAATCYCLKQSVDAGACRFDGQGRARRGIGRSRRARPAARRRARPGQCRRSAVGRPVPPAPRATRRRRQTGGRRGAGRFPGGDRPLQPDCGRLQQPVRRPAGAAATARAAQLPDAPSRTVPCKAPPARPAVRRSRPRRRRARRGRSSCAARCGRRRRAGRPAAARCRRRNRAAAP